MATINICKYTILAVIPTSQRTLLFDYYFSSPFLQCSHKNFLATGNIF